MALPIPKARFRWSSVSAQAGRRNLRCVLLACILFMAILWHPVSALAQPSLVSVSPPDLATGVPSTPSIDFQFSSPMQSTQVVIVQVASGQPYTESSLSYRWSADGRTLGVQSPTSFPPGSTVLWAIDEKGFAEQGHGAPLDKDYGGSFVVSTNGIIRTPPLVTLRKAAHHLLGAGGVPVPLQTNGFAMDARMGAAPSNQTVAVQLADPLDRRTSLFSTFDDATNYVAKVFFNSEALLRTAFPPGPYACKIHTGYSDDNVDMDFPDIPFPAAPRILNYSQTAGIDPKKPFVLQAAWNGSLSNYATIRVTDHLSGSNLFSTPPRGDPTALNGLSNMVTLPAQLLQPGQQYDLEMELWAMTTNNSAIAAVQTWIGSSTTIRLVTRYPLFRIAEWTRSGPASMTMAVESEPGATYVLERSIDLASWNPMATNTATSASVTFPVATSDAPSGFFRIGRR